VIQWKCGHSYAANVATAGKYRMEPCGPMPARNAAAQTSTGHRKNAATAGGAEGAGKEGGISNPLSFSMRTKPVILLCGLAR